MSRRAALLLAAALWAAGTATARAAEVLAVEVSHNQGRYGVHFDVRLAAPLPRLARYINDYERYAEYFGPITESTVLARGPDGRVRLRLRAEACILFFCRTATVVKDVIDNGRGDIWAHADPRFSDFHEVSERWRIRPEGAQTRMEYNATLVPKFFVPPLIGPWVIKLRIRDSLLSGAETLETLARE